MKLSKAVCAVSCPLAFVWLTPNTVLATPNLFTFGPLPEATFGGQGIPNDEVAAFDNGPAGLGVIDITALLNYGLLRHSVEHHLVEGANANGLMRRAAINDWAASVDPDGIAVNQGDYNNEI